jgi:hypothetical protein
MEKGRYKVRNKMQFKESNLYLNYGDVFELTDSLKDDRVEIVVDGKSYTVDQDVVNTCSTPFKY